MHAAVIAIAATRQCNRDATAAATATGGGGSTAVAVRARARARRSDYGGVTRQCRRGRRDAARICMAVLVTLACEAGR